MTPSIYLQTPTSPVLTTQKEEHPSPNHLQEITWGIWDQNFKSPCSELDGAADMSSPGTRNWPAGSIHLFSVLGSQHGHNFRGFQQRLAAVILIPAFFPRSHDSEVRPQSTEISGKVWNANLSHDLQERKGNRRLFYQQEQSRFFKVKKKWKKAHFREGGGRHVSLDCIKVSKLSQNVLQVPISFFHFWIALRKMLHK